MPGSKIPVLEIEKLTITRDGRGIHVFNDGDTYYSGGNTTWTGVSSTCSGASNEFLVAASATASVIVWPATAASASVAFQGTGATLPSTILAADELTAIATLASAKSMAFLSDHLIKTCFVSAAGSGTWISAII